jgi:cold shock CspA family protein
MEGIIKFWNPEKLFGFVVADDGQEFYTSARRINLEGKRVRFDLETKSPDDVWTQKLNDGRLRDAEGVNSRNPRPPRPTSFKPTATNVTVLEEKL